MVEKRAGKEVVRSVMDLVEDDPHFLVHWFVIALFPRKGGAVGFGKMDSVGGKDRVEIAMGIFEMDLGWGFANCYLQTRQGLSRT